MKKRIYGNKHIYAYQASIRKKPIHWHDEIEIILVLYGSVRLKIGYDEMVLKESEIMFINSDEIHSLHQTDESNKILFLYLDKNYYFKYIPELWNAFFYIPEYSLAKKELNNKNHMFHKFIAKIVIELQKDSYSQKLNRLVIRFIKNLIACYQLISSNYSIVHTNTEKLERIYRMFQYLYSNFSRRLELKEICTYEHLNFYYMSHFIKNSTGFNFREWLNYVRVEHSEKLLLATNKSIAAIADECGFSDVRYFNKYFKKWHHYSPLKFRKIFRPITGNKNLSADYDEYLSINQLKSYLNTNAACTDSSMDLFNHKINF